MSRSNPGKQKRRAASKTLLVYGEGPAEQVFMTHLKGLYAEGNDVSVLIRKGKGGAADRIVIDADNTPGAFTRKIVVLDNDKSTTEMDNARREAKQRKIDLFENTPCLEAVLLSILNGGRSFASKGTPWCKSEFESKFIDGRKRTEIKECAKVFPKTLLDAQRTKVAELGRLIDLMEGL